MMPAPSREAGAANNASVLHPSEGEERAVQERDLMTMQSPSPQKDISCKRSITALSAEAGLLRAEEQHEWQEQVARKDSQINELDKLIEDNLVTIESLRAEVKMRKESEEQMKQVLKEYEKVRRRTPVDHTIIVLRALPSAADHIRTNCREREGEELLRTGPAKPAGGA